MVQQQYDDEIDIREYIEVLIKNWKTVVITSVLIAVIAFVFSIVQKPIYEAKATILIRSGGSSAVAQYAGLAGMLGANLGSSGGNVGDLSELLKSRAVAVKVLDDLKLTTRIKGWDNPAIKREKMASAVIGMLKPVKTSGNVFEIKAEANDPQLTADIANGYVNALSYFWNEMNYTEAQKKLKYIRSELPRVESELKIVESKLKLTPRSATGFSLSGQGSLQRDFEIYSSVYTMLRKELESTKLDASKEIPPFSMLDPALTPERPSRPKVKLNVGIGLVAGIFLGILLAFVQDYWGKQV